MHGPADAPSIRNAAGCSTLILVLSEDREFWSISSALYHEKIRTQLKQTNKAQKIFKLTTDSALVRAAPE